MAETVQTPVKRSPPHKRKITESDDFFLAIAKLTPKFEGGKSRMTTAKKQTCYDSQNCLKIVKS